MDIAWLVAGRARELERLERGARQLSDPVARLRWLRQRIKQLERGQPSGLRARAILIALCALLLCSAPTGSTASRPPLSTCTRLGPATGDAVWLVEESPESELYSNGLRIERRWVTSAEPRRPRWLARSPEADGPPPDPAGIVFHASESETPPLLPEHSGRLLRQGEELLNWVRRHKLYHYVVDRFGRVFRILPDQQRASHAGQSVWADQRWVYFDLSESFLGICFEARTSGLEPTELTLPQVRAGRLLVEVLRAIYKFPPQNCLTHAQVSVNQANGLVGYHTDWASGFPFEQLGLPGNYAQPLPSLLLFGFEADRSFVQRAGPQLREAVEAARWEVSRRALAEGLTPAEYRRRLMEQYRNAMSQAGNN